MKDQETRVWRERDFTKKQWGIVRVYVGEVAVWTVVTVDSHKGAVANVYLPLCNWPLFVCACITTSLGEGKCRAL